jgi:hypothetical protein
MDEYTRLIEPDEDVDRMSLSDFADCIKTGLFTNDDGYAIPVEPNGHRLHKSIKLYPSNWLQNIPSNVTEIVWINR